MHIQVKNNMVVVVVVMMMMMNNLRQLSYKLRPTANLGTEVARV